MSTFADYLQRLLVGPLAGSWGVRFVRSLGGALDAAGEALQDAGLLRGPLDAQDDALPALGISRRIERAPGEGIDAFRARLVGAWESWGWTTTRYGIAEAVALLGYGLPAVWGYRELPPDATFARWARVVVVYRGLPAWDGAATWDGEDTWDSLRRADPIEGLAEADVAPVLRRVLRQWVGARDVVDRVVLAFGSLLWDLDSAWDGEDVWDEGDGWAVWQSPAWDSADRDALWDDPRPAWDAFC